MKVLIDRTFPRYKQLQNKEMYFIMIAGEQDISACTGCEKSLMGFLECLPNAQLKGVVYGIGAWNKGNINSEAMNKPIN